MNQCKVCGNSVEHFMDFGEMPIANGFIPKGFEDNEYRFKMEVAVCEKCKTFQLIHQPEPEKMFHENYAFYSSQSKKMNEHFHELAEIILKKYIIDSSNSLIVEIGSNDGIFLKNFIGKKITHLGIEPSKNVAEVAISKGVKTISKFFNKDTAVNIIEEYGHADVIVSANVMCHIADINSVVNGISTLLKEDGVLIFEDPYLGDMIEKISYDQIYDEHVFIFSATSVSNIFKSHGMELIDVIPQATHGGSMRYILAKSGKKNISQRVIDTLIKENHIGLNGMEAYKNFKASCEKSKKELTNLIQKLKDEGAKVVGYGATSKSTTILNYCGIGAGSIDYICDTTPIKQNKLTPGMHIPVVSHDVFLEDKPDYAILFAWNHAEEIFSKEKDFTKKGGKWITFVPRVGILND